MQKRAYFNSERRKGWPGPDEIRPFFFQRNGKIWFDTGGNDTAGLHAEGLYGTQDLEEPKRVVVHLSMWGSPEHGVMLLYRKFGGGFREAFTSKGDLLRLKEYMRTLHDDLMPVGLFIPFASAWEAVKEFIETNGELPKCIEWVANDDLPAGTFPEP